jgi:hypothetical protein
MNVFIGIRGDKNSALLLIFVKRGARRLTHGFSGGIGRKAVPVFRQDA